MKLDHPNIVTLYATLQDAACLYYLLEYLENGELWNALFYKEDSQDKFDYPIGIPPSLVKFYVAELINVLEYMHRYSIRYILPAVFYYYILLVSYISKLYICIHCLPLIIINILTFMLLFLKFMRYE